MSERYAWSVGSTSSGKPRSGPRVAASRDTSVVGEVPAVMPGSSPVAPGSGGLSKSSSTVPPRVGLEPRGGCLGRTEEVPQVASLGPNIPTDWCSAGSACTDPVGVGHHGRARAPGVGPHGAGLGPNYRVVVRRGGSDQRMPRLRRLSGDEVVALLGRFGFQVQSQRGSHVESRRADPGGSNQTLTIARHAKLGTAPSRPSSSRLAGSSRKTSSGGTSTRR